MNGVSKLHGAVGQTPTTDYCTPLGLPQDACAITSAIPTVTAATLYNASSVLTTFKQWYAAINGGSAPPADNTSGVYTSGQSAANLITAAANYWASVGVADVADTTSINPTAWGFPWQFALTSTTADPTTAMTTAFTNMLGNAAAVASLNSGVLPVFDPTTTNWNNVSPATSWSTIANSVANILPTLQAFVVAGGKCGLFSQALANVQAAWNAYLSAQTDPCTGVTPAVTPGAPAPITPSGVVPSNAQPVIVISGAVPKPGIGTWGAIGLTVLGGALVGGYFYFKKHKARSNPVEDEYSAYRQELIDILVNNYGYSKNSVIELLDNGRVAQGYFEKQYPPRLAAKNVNRVFKQRLSGHGVAPTRLKFLSIEAYNAFRKEVADNLIAYGIYENEAYDILDSRVDVRYDQTLAQSFFEAGVSSEEATRRIIEGIKTSMQQQLNTPPKIRSNPIGDFDSSYRAFRQQLTDILVSQYGYPYRSAVRIIDLEAPNGDTLADYCFRKQFTARKAAANIDATIRDVYPMLRPEDW